MSKPPGPPKDEPPSEEGERRAPIEKTSGRITFDSKGNASWEWRMRTGVFGRDIDTKRLRNLTPSELKIMEDPAVQTSGQKVPGSTGATAKSRPHSVGSSKKPGGGFDPYNTSSPPKPLVAHPQAIPAVPKTRIVAPPAKRSVWERVRGWLGRS